MMQPMQPWTWTTPGTISGGQTWTYGQRRRVYKSCMGWTVTGHPLGTQTFWTWRQAMDYAARNYYLHNYMDHPQTYSMGTA